MSTAGGIWQARTWPPGWNVRYVDRTGSTNEDLRRALASGEVGQRSVLVAGHQTAGRGRLDRRWEAPPDVNLLVSFAFTEVPDPAVELTHRVGLAVARALGSLTATERVGLKWPNDVLLDDLKVAGILAVRSTGPDGVPAGIVVGVGVNVGWAPAGAARLGPDHEPADVLLETLTAYDALPDEVQPAYRAALRTLGARVRVELPGGDHVVGRAVDVGADGRLAVLDDCAVTHHLDVGDVVHLRPADPA